MQNRTINCIECIKQRFLFSVREIILIINWFIQRSIFDLVPFTFLMLIHGTMGVVLYLFTDMTKMMTLFMFEHKHFMIWDII